MYESTHPSPATTFAVETFHLPCTTICGTLTYTRPHPRVASDTVIRLLHQLASTLFQPSATAPNECTSVDPPSSHANSDPKATSTSGGPASASTDVAHGATCQKLFESARIVISQLEIDMKAAAAPLRVDDYGDVSCEICRSPEEDEQIVLCDHCNRGYHLACLSPPLTTVPEGSWFCSAVCGSGTRAVASHCPTSSVSHSIAQRLSSVAPSHAMPFAHTTRFDLSPCPTFPCCPPADAAFAATHSRQPTLRIGRNWHRTNDGVVRRCGRQCSYAWRLCFRSYRPTSRGSRQWWRSWHRRL